MSREIVINGRFLTQSLTGVQRYARELLAAVDLTLARRPDLVVRLLTPPLAPAAIPPLRHVRHEVIGRGGGHRWEQLVLPRHVGDAILFCPGNTAPVRSLLGRATVVVTVHDLSYRYFPEAYSRAFRLLYNSLIPFVLRRADRVLTVSRSEHEAIVAHYPFAREKLIAIQNGGLPVGIAPQSPALSPVPTVLYVGTLSKRKNFPAMLDVAIRVTRRRDVHFAFIGGVPAGLVKSLADLPADVRERIHFHGQIDDWDRLIAAYRGARCFLFPSLYEASPLPPIEAMGCGCPVVAGAIPSLLERCGDAARYCDPHEPASIEAAIDALLDDPELAETLRERGYRQAAQFSWEACAEATLAAILDEGVGA